MFKVEYISSLESLEMPIAYYNCFYGIFGACAK